MTERTERQRREFWKMSFFDGIGSPAGDRRFRLKCDDMDLAKNEYIRLTPGRIELPAPLVARASRAKDFEDCVWSNDSLDIGSHRLRLLFEQLCPQDVQYIPVTVFFRQKRLDVQYWLFKYIRDIDCARAEGATTGPDDDYFFWSIDPARVPLDAGVFYTTRALRKPIVRDRVRRAMIKEKMTGCMFYATDSSTQSPFVE